MEEKQIFTLAQVATSIKKTLENRYNQLYWIKAEMYKINRYPSGHAFPELVQKEGDKIVAQLTGTIWKQQLERIQKRFVEVVKEPLKDGLTVLFLGKIVFSETFGLSIQIMDIDPSFSLGELQKERDETLKKLAEEGLLNKNQLLSFPLLPKRIAIISGDTSKGLSDFLEVLLNNPYQYRFETTLFNALLQGDVAVDSIIQALNSIQSSRHRYDIVVLVRGGGAEVGMTCYNHFKLCKEIAEFPLPILTGIGHSTNLTVAELIAFRNEITPTKLAELLVQTFREFDLNVQELTSNLRDMSMLKIERAQQQISQLTHAFEKSSKNLMQQFSFSIHTTQQQAAQAAMHVLHREKTLLSNLQGEASASAIEKLRNGAFQLERKQYDLSLFTSKITEQQLLQLESLSSKVELLDPIRIVNRGFSIARRNGKVVSSDNKPEIGEEIELITAIGEMKSIVTSIQNNEKETKK
ncbi:MAG: exodeoxyribonuclease VII large subunit [Crocinitomicaceae bacterium]